MSRPNISESNQELQLSRYYFRKQRCQIRICLDKMRMGGMREGACSCDWVTRVPTNRTSPRPSNEHESFLVTRMHFWYLCSWEFCTHSPSPSRPPTCHRGCFVEEGRTDGNRGCCNLCMCRAKLMGNGNRQDLSPLQEELVPITWLAVLSCVAVRRLELFLCCVWWAMPLSCDVCVCGCVRGEMYPWRFGHAFVFSFPVKRKFS